MRTIIVRNFYIYCADKISQPKILNPGTKIFHFTLKFVTTEHRQKLKQTKHESPNQLVNNDTNAGNGNSNNRLDFNYLLKIVLDIYLYKSFHNQLFLPVSPQIRLVLRLYRLPDQDQ